MNGLRNVELRKRHKRNLILDIIRTEPNASRTSIRTLSRLGMETVLQNIDALLRDGLIYESGSGGAGVGRKATWLAINPAGRAFIGVKFNALGMSSAVVDFAGNVIRSGFDAFPPSFHARDALDALIACVERQVRWLEGQKRAIGGIGIGVPGMVSSETGVALRFVQIEGWENIPVQEIIERRFGYPTATEQSIKVTALAHLMRPENIDLQYMLYVLVKSGVGMTIVQNRQLVSGATDSAGEIGHMRVPGGTARCSCGKTGCLEAEIGYRALVAKMEKGLAAGRFPVLRGLLCGRAPQIHDLLAAVGGNDPDALALYHDVCRMLGDVLVPAVTLINPQKIIFSGEIPSIPGFLDDMTARVAAGCPLTAIPALQMAVSEDDPAFDAEGAALLALYREFGAFGASRAAVAEEQD